ncbi:hypothetical protein D3C71_1872670 [compost metagenome]
MQTETSYCSVPSQPSIDGDYTSLSPDFNAGYCFGTVGAVMDTMINLYYDLPKDAKACFPENGIQYGQAVRIVTRYLSDHPASLHKSGSMLSIEAFKAAYPCK